MKLKHIICNIAISLSALYCAHATEPLPPVLLGDYEMHGEVKNWHGYILNNVRGTLSCTSYLGSGYRLSFSFKTGKASAFFSPSGRYKVILREGSKVTVRIGRWTVDSANSSLVWSTFRSSEDHKIHHENFGFVYNSAGSAIYVGFFLQPGVFFNIFTTARH